MVKNSPANAGASGVVVLIPGSERYLGKGNGSLLQYFCPGNPMDREAWRAAVLGSQESNRTEHTSRNPIHLITSQRLYLQTPSLWGLGFNL